MFRDGSRPLSEIEISRLNHFLSVDFPGVVELRSQARVARAIETQDRYTILFDLPAGAPEAAVAWVHPVEGRCMAGNVPIEFELYVIAGRLKLMGFVFNAWLSPEQEVIPVLDAFTIYVFDANLKDFRPTVKGTLPTWQRKLSLNNG